MYLDWKKVSSPNYPLQLDTTEKTSSGQVKNNLAQNIQSRIKTTEPGMGEAAAKAKNRAGWQSLILTFCSIESEKGRQLGRFGDSISNFVFEKEGKYISNCQINKHQKILQLKEIHIMYYLIAYNVQVCVSTFNISIVSRHQIQVNIYMHTCTYIIRRWQGTLRDRFCVHRIRFYILPKTEIFTTKGEVCQVNRSI